MIHEKIDGILGQKTTYVYEGLDRLDTATITPTSSSTNLATYRRRRAKRFAEMVVDAILP